MSVVPGLAVPATVSATDTKDAAFAEVPGAGVSPGEGPVAGECAGSVDGAGGGAGAASSTQRQPSGGVTSEGAGAGAARLMLDRSAWVGSASVCGVPTRCVQLPAGKQGGPSSGFKDCC